MVNWKNTLLTRASALHLKVSSYTTRGKQSHYKDFSNVIVLSGILPRNLESILLNVSSMEYTYFTYVIYNLSFLKPEFNLNFVDVYKLSLSENIEWFCKQRQKQLFQKSERITRVI